jgi:hypothetical protein
MILLQFQPLILLIAVMLVTRSLVATSFLGEVLTVFVIPNIHKVKLPGTPLMDHRLSLDTSS